MARNKKHQSGAVWFIPAVKAFFLCLLLGGTAVGYVLQKNNIYELGRQITVLESTLERLKWENKINASQLADLQLPHRLAERVRDQRMGLLPPQPGQVVWLPEPANLPATNAQLPAGTVRP
jgi:hypothetical protein